MFWKVIASEGLIIAVFVFMWRLPPAGQMWVVLSPYMALASIWCGVFAIVLSALLWWVSVPDYLLPIVLLALDPAAIATGALVLWTHRGAAADHVAVQLQRTQAWIAIGLGVTASAMAYFFVSTHYAGGLLW